MTSRTLLRCVDGSHAGDSLPCAFFDHEKPLAVREQIERLGATGRAIVFVQDWLEELKEGEPVNQ